MSSGLTGTEGYSQAHCLTFEDVGLEYGGDTQGISDYVYDDFTLPSQTQSSQSQASQQPQPTPGTAMCGTCLMEKCENYCYWVLIGVRGSRTYSS